MRRHDDIGQDEQAWVDAGFVLPNAAAMARTHGHRAGVLRFRFNSGLRREALIRAELGNMGKPRQQNREGAYLI